MKERVKPSGLTSRTTKGVAKESSKELLDMPQKVRHYLGHFLWKEKLSMIMHLS